MGNSGQDVLTGTDYTVGQWQHLVVTWDPQTDNADPGGNGNNQWSGLLTVYVNGVSVATNNSALYSANREATETSSAAADLGVGSYNGFCSEPMGFSAGFFRIEIIMALTRQDSIHKV